MEHRRQLLQAMAAGTLTVWMARALAAGSQPLPPGLRRIKGEVRVNGALAQEGRVILVGDTISTGPGAEAVYVIGRDAYLLRENTMVVHQELDSAGIVRVLAGKLLGVFGSGEKRIETSLATIGIRGTGLYLEAGDAQLYFCLCYGVADVLPTADPSQGQRVETSYHDSPFYITADFSGPLMRPAPVINHFDSELILLEGTVGRRPPFPAGQDAYGSRATGRGGRSSSGGSAASAGTGRGGNAAGR